jgi:hypothetical protein
MYRPPWQLSSSGAAAPYDFIQQTQTSALRLRASRLALDPRFNFDALCASASAPSRDRLGAMCASNRHVLGGTSFGALILLDAERSVLGGQVPRAHDGPVADVSFYDDEDDGLFVSVGTRDRVLKVWDKSALESCGALGLGAMPHCVALSPKERSLVGVGLSTGGARVFDLDSGRQSHVVAGHAGSVLCVAWSPRSPHVLATGGEDCTVRVWDLRRTSACLASLDEQDQAQNVVGTSDQKRLRLVGQGQASSVVRAHQGPVVALQFLRGGQDLLSWGREDGLHLWRTMNNGALRNTFVDFGPVWGGASVHRRFALDALAGVLFMPAASGLEMCCLDLESGARIVPGYGPGHMDKITMQAYTQAGGLYTCGADGKLLCWTSQGGKNDPMGDARMDEDDWSD